MQRKKSFKLANMALVNCFTVVSCLLAVTPFLSGAHRAAAQSSGAAQEIPSSVRAGSQVRLADHTPAQVLDGTAMRLSHYNPAQKLRLTLAVQRPRMAEEERFLTALQTKGSPLFHQFLTAEEWTESFGPSVEDEQKVVDWAQETGFTVTHRFANRLLVDVEAPAGVIEKALGVTINRYQVGDEVDFANDRDPLIPESLGGVLSSVAGLNSIHRVHQVSGKAPGRTGPDYAPGPASSEIDSSHGDGDPTQSPMARAAARAAEQAAGVTAKPDNNAPTGPIQTNGYIDPAELYSSNTYNYGALYDQGHCCNVHNDSGGSPPDTSIALVTLADFDTSNVITFFQTFGLAWNYTRYSIDGTNNPGTECGADTTGCVTAGQDGEAVLDLSYSTAMANSFGSSVDTSHVYVYEGVNNLDSTYEDIFNFVLSDGHAKVLSTSWAWPEYTWTSSEISTLHGIFNSMVGQGITLIGAAGDQGATSGCTALDAVMYPASDPDFIAAGGTTLAINYSNGDYVSEVAWTGGTTIKDCDGNGGGGGGGNSVLFGLPSWQSGLPGAGSARMLPDFSLKAGGYGQALYGGSSSTLGGVDGTSIVAPEMAGFFAQENAYLNYIGHICGSKGTSACEPIGNPNPVLYYEGAKNNAAHYPFYDITSGCNSNYYTANSPGVKAFCAGPGYDQATGWGSANMLQLAWALNWEIIPASGEPYITWSGPAVNKWYNTNQTVSWTIHDWEPAGSTPGSGIAGETQGWDSIPSDPEKEAMPGSGNSFYSGPQFPNGSTGCLAFEPNGCAGGVSQGCHTAWARGWNNQGWSTKGSAGSGYPESYGPICYDTVAPTVSVTYSPATPASGWYNAPVAISITANDPGGSGASGVSHIYYGTSTGTAAGPCTTSNTSKCAVYGSTVSLNTQEQVNFTAFSEDKAGNFSTTTGKVIGIDWTPPATTAGFSGTLASGLWTNSTSIVLKATDNLSGVAHTYYTLDGGAQTTYSAAFTVSTAGSHTLTYWSVDNAGNAEKKNVDSFKVASSTATTLTASPNPSVNGQKVTLTAKVSPTDSAPATGTITFTMGSTKLGTATLSGGTASMTTTAIPVGSDTLWAGFTGTTYYLNSNSSTLTQVVHETTTTALTVAPSPGAFGSTVTLTAKVKPSVSGTPTGNVEFLNGSTSLGTGSVNSSGQASLNTTALPVGTDSLTAVYSGDKTYTTSTSPVVKETVNKATSTTALKSSGTTTSYDESVTLTATVTSAGGKPTGTVTFYSGTTSLGTATLSAGVATLATKTLPVGTDSIKAEYGGSSDFGASTSTALSIVNDPAPTTTKVKSSLNPSTWGASVTFTATVTSSPGTPAGTVTFKDGTTTLGSATLSSGAATLAITTLAVGSHSITAEYIATTDYATSTSSAVNETVNKATSATALKSSATTTSYDESVTLTATVTSAGGKPTGTVTFLSGTTTIGTSTLSAGVAALATKGLPVGTDSVKAEYGGSSDFGASTSAALSIVNDPAPTTTAIKSSLNPSTVGTSVTFTATVTSSPGTPAGTVTFKDGTTTLGSATLSSGVATLAIKTLAAGSNSITAEYAGTTNYATSTSTALKQTVNAASSARAAHLPD